MQSAKSIIAVAWPYANGDLHLGHPAGYLLPADIMNKFLRLKGEDVIMVSGSDMHGTPIAVKAMKEGVEPDVFAKQQHKRHIEVMKILGMDYSLYTSTATDLHEKVVQEMFTLLETKGFISKNTDELYWSEKEHKFLLDRYIEGECPYCDYSSARGDQCDNCGRTLTPDRLVNPYSVFGDKELVKKKSTNYYLNLDKLQPLLEAHYKDAGGAGGSLGNWRRHVWGTTKAWLDEGLEPRAITRDMEGYGVNLPIAYEIDGEEGKVIYVWFEAVSGYLTASMELALRNGQDEQGDAGNKDTLSERVGMLDLNTDESDKLATNTYVGQSLIWQDYWFGKNTKSYYFMGKDNIPFHSIIWPGMLLGLSDGEESKLNLPWNIPANQYLNLKGAKFSKSKGNVIDTREFVDRFGLTAVRYFLITRMPENKDYDFTWNEFVEANNNELAANLGNLVNRTLVFWNKYFAGKHVLETSFEVTDEVRAAVETAYTTSEEMFYKCQFVDAFSQTMTLGNFGNKYFNDAEIWHVIKDDEEAALKIMQELLYIVANISALLRPFLPDLSEAIYDYLGIDTLELAVGKDQWQAIQPNLAGLDKIKGLKPLIAKLDLDEILAEFME